MGQFTGIAILTGLSISGAWISATWIHNKGIIGLLGFIPIILGIQALYNNKKGGGDIISDGRRGFSQTIAVAGLTISGGYDNLGVYIPLFASTNAWEVGIISCIFLVLTGIWCILANWCSQGIQHIGKHHFGIHDITERLEKAFPWVLISLGVYVLFVNGSFLMILKQIHIGAI